jgi:hypothetical protein
VKFYLAGPMTGHPEFNYPAFEKAAMILREGVKLDLACPHEVIHDGVDGIRGALPYEEYVRAGLKLLLECQAIILMSGWETSKGAINELMVAKMCNMKVYFWNESTFTLSTTGG